MDEIARLAEDIANDHPGCQIFVSIGAKIGMSAREFDRLVYEVKIRQSSIELSRVPQETNRDSPKITSSKSICN